MALKRFVKIPSGNQVLDQVQDSLGLIVNGTSDDVRVLQTLLANAEFVTMSVTTPATGFPNGYPYVNAATSAGQSIPNSANTVVNMSTVGTDTDNAITVGSGWKWTCPAGKSGLYSISEQISLNATASGVGDQILGIQKNGSEFVRLQRAPSNTTKETGLSGTIMLNLNAGDTIAPLIFQNSGGAVTLESSLITNWITITGINLNQQPVLSCFPVTIPAKKVTNPKFALVASCVDTSATPLVPALGTPSVAVSGTALQLTNFPGLLLGRTYTVTLLLVGG